MPAFTARNGSGEPRLAAPLRPQSTPERPQPGGPSPFLGGGRAAGDARAAGALVHAASQLCSPARPGRGNRIVPGAERRCVAAPSSLVGPGTSTRVLRGRGWRGTRNGVCRRARLGPGPRTWPHTPVRHAPFRACGQWAGHPKSRQSPRAAGTRRLHLRGQTSVTRRRTHGRTVLPVGGLSGRPVGGACSPVPAPDGSA